MTAAKGLLDHDEVYIRVATKNMRNRADGQYFTCSPTSDEMTAEEGTDRAVVLTKIASSLWTASLSLMPNAPENDFLDGLSELNRNTPGGFGFSFSFRHKRTVLISTVAFIARKPDISKSRTTGDSMTWNLLLPDYNGKIGGFTLDSNKPIPQAVLDLAP